MRIEASGKVGIGVSSGLGGVLTLPHQESISFHDAGGAARRALEFDTGELLHGSAGAGITAQTFYTNGSERLRIDGSGNVGIGTDAPSGNLDVTSAISTSIDIQGGDGNSKNIIFRKTTGGAQQAKIRAVGDDLQFFTGPTDERMRIDSSGNLLVNKTATSTSGNGHILYASGEQYLFQNGTSSEQQVRFYRNVDATPALVGSISTTGSATSYNTSSDVRLKENITDAPEGNVDALQVRSFDWKADGSHQEYGFIAQELETVAPYAVTKGETEEDMWAVDYSKLVPMLVKELQDAKARIAALEAGHAL
jgi:hypothetical protein